MLVRCEAQVRAFVKSTCTRYVLGMGTRWVGLGMYSIKKKIEKKIGYSSGTVGYDSGTNLN